MGCRGSRRPGLGVNGSHKGSKPDSERYHVSTGRSVGEWEGGKDQGFLELWAVTRDHMNVPIQVLESALGCVGQVPAVQSTVTVDARAQALMPGKKHLSSNPRELHPK